MPCMKNNCKTIKSFQERVVKKYGLLVKSLIYELARIFKNIGNIYEEIKEYETHVRRI